MGKEEREGEEKKKVSIEKRMVQQMMGLVSWFRWLVDWEASGREGGGGCGVVSIIERQAEQYHPNSGKQTPASIHRAKRGQIRTKCHRSIRRSRPV